uniref:Pectate lyase n=1 Tax=Anisakis simplex TaxID=6269 RepID=A0A0M3JHZ3_ANISI
LTHAAAAADPLSGQGERSGGGVTAGSGVIQPAQQQGQGGGGGKKKKKGGKGGKVVVDGACLGFKATADPNRINIGEIDTVQTQGNQTAWW